MSAMRVELGRVRDLAGKLEREMRDIDEALAGVSGATVTTPGEWRRATRVERIRQLIARHNEVRGRLARMREALDV